MPTTSTLSKAQPAGVIQAYDANGAPAQISPGTTGQVLTSNGAGATPTFQTGGGGVTIKQGLRSALPSVAGQITGNTYYCTDSPYEYVFDGSVWQPFVFGFNVVEPVLANFTQVKVDLTTFDTTHGGIIFQVPNNSSAEDFQYIAQAIPASGAYNVDCAFILGLVGANNATGVGGAGSVISGGLTSADKLSAIAIGNDSGYGSEYIIKLYNNPTSLNLNQNHGGFINRGPLIWTRYKDDRTTNRVAFLSMNGQNWIQVQSESRTNLFTPADCGFGVTPFAATVHAWLIHFSVH